LIFDLHDDGFGGSAFDLLSAVASRAVSFKKERTNKGLRKKAKAQAVADRQSRAALAWALLP